MSGLRFRYPRTYHLPWSPGATSDDKVLGDVAHFDGKRVIVSKKMDGENCVRGDALIETTAGPIPVADLVAHRRQVDVLSLNRRTGEIEPQPVTNWIVSPAADEWYEIETFDGAKVCLTGEHRVFSPFSETYREARCLHEGDLVVSLCRSSADREVRPGRAPAAIRAIRKIRLPAARYDLTVARNHNFFANGILVHNCSIYSDGYIHARSLDGHGGPDRDWVKGFSRQWCFLLPPGWRVCGENMWARHSISYDDLPSYFLGFSLWNEHNVCLPWDETMEFFERLGVASVPVLYDGEWDLSAIKAVEAGLDLTKDEGYVVRVAGSFSHDEFSSNVAKYVRAGHVQSDRHWRQAPLVQNRLR